MRIVAFILAVVVLALSLVPCADLDEMRIAEQHQQETARQLPCRHEADPQRDLCSPFCHCACCASFPVVKEPITISAPLFFTVNAPVFASYVHQRPVNVSLPVWQPPQLV